MKQLRLLLTPICNRACEGCCNKQWNLDELPVVKSYAGYELIMLTGGEPMLFPDLVRCVIVDIRMQTNAPIYLYTARTQGLLEMLPFLGGVTLTLHEQSDVAPFQAFNRYKLTGSLRLNVFDGIDLGDVDLSRWQVKQNIQWIEDCPLPVDEVFMRLGPCAVAR